MSTHINKLARLIKFRYQRHWLFLLTVAPLSICALLFSASPAYAQQVVSKDVTVNESAGSADFTASLIIRRPLTYDLNIYYSTTDGTATSPSDYTGTQQGMVTIPQGKTATTISVPIIDDTVPESSETFTLTIQQPDESPSTSYVATIIDNDVVAPPPPPPPPIAPPPPAPPAKPPVVAPPPPPLPDAPPPVAPPPPLPPTIDFVPPAPRSTHSTISLRTIGAVAGRGSPNSWSTLKKLNTGHPHGATGNVSGRNVQFHSPVKL